MTLVNPNLDVKVEKYIQDTKGRFLILDQSQATLTALCLKMTKKVEIQFGKKSIVIKEVQHLVNLYLTDIWRDYNPNDSRFAWRNKSLKIQCRLEFFLISKELSSDTPACNIINAPETDHSVITLHLKTEDLLQPKAPGFWKFNNSLLDDEDFTSAIR